MSKLKTPHYFWITAVFILLIGVSSFFDENDIIDINVHDTYFVIRNSHLTTLLFVIYGIIGFCYWLFFKYEIILVRNLTNIHSIITIGSIYIYEIGMIYYNFKTDSSFPLFDDDILNQNLFTLIIVMLVLFTQLLFITNIILSTIKYSIYYFLMKKR